MKLRNILCKISILLYKKNEFNKEKWWLGWTCEDD